MALDKWKKIWDAVMKKSLKHVTLTLGQCVRQTLKGLQEDC